MRAALVLLGLATVAHADTAIDRARELEAKLAYDEALVIIDAAIQSGQSDRARLVELHLIAGRLSAGLDRVKEAENHFAIVLALDPSRTLSDDTSPKISVPFTVARTKAQPLEVRLDATKTSVRVQAAPLVAGIAVRYADGRTETNRTSTSLPTQGSVIEVKALDIHGNVLWTGAPPVETIETPPVRVTHDEPGLFGRWTTWAAITGVALATGGVAAWRFDAAQDEFDSKQKAGMTSFTDLQDIEDRGRRWGLTANISFGIAAATAITSIVLFVRRPTVVATPNTVGVAGTF